VARDRALITGGRGPDEQHDDSVVQPGGREEEQQIASGRPSTTPFALVGIVAIAIWIVVAVVAAIAFVVFWLV
jgi:hypothetical protein